MFGHLLRDFHTFAVSLSTLCRFTLGDFDYDVSCVVAATPHRDSLTTRCSQPQDLAKTRPRLAVWFFWAFNGIVFVVVMNMFIAIVTKYFDVVHTVRSAGCQQPLQPHTHTMCLANQEAATSELWKDGMPGLWWDSVVTVRRFMRRHVKPGLDACKDFICCCRSCRRRRREQQRDSVRTGGRPPSRCCWCCTKRQNPRLWEGSTTPRGNVQASLEAHYKSKQLLVRYDVVD